MSERSAEIVKFDNVGLRYGTDPEVLSNLSFTLYPGSFYLLTGASGAGLARCCMSHAVRSASWLGLNTRSYDGMGD